MIIKDDAVYLHRMTPPDVVMNLTFLGVQTRDFVLLGDMPHWPLYIPDWCKWLARFNDIPDVPTTTIQLKDFKDALLAKGLILHNVPGSSKLDIMPRFSVEIQEDEEQGLLWAIVLDQTTSKTLHQIGPEPYSRGPLSKKPNKQRLSSIISSEADYWLSIHASHHRDPLLSWLNTGRIIWEAQEFLSRITALFTEIPSLLPHFGQEVRRQKHLKAIRQDLMDLFNTNPQLAEAVYHYLRKQWREKTGTDLVS